MQYAKDSINKAFLINGMSVIALFITPILFLILILSGFASPITLCAVAVPAVFFLMGSFERTALIFLGAIALKTVFLTKSFTIITALFVLLITSYLATKQKFSIAGIFRESWLSRLILAFSLWEFLLVIMASHSIPLYYSLRALIAIVIPIVCFFLFSSYVINPRRLLSVIFIILIFPFLESILGILQSFSGNFYLTPPNSDRPLDQLLNRAYLGYLLPAFFSKYSFEARGTFGWINTFGNYLVLFSPLAFVSAFAQGQYSKNQILKKIFYWIFAIAIFLGIFFSYSRSSLLGLVAGFIILIYMNRTKLIIFSSSAIMLCSIILALFVYWDKIIDIFIIYSSNSSDLFKATGRLLRWDATVNKIFTSVQSLVFGNGVLLGHNYDEEVIFSRIGYYRQGHNSYLDIWEAEGLVSLILILALIVFSMYSLRTAYRKANDPRIRYTALGLLISLISFCVSQIFDHKLAWWLEFRIPFFILLGLTDSILRFRRNSGHVIFPKKL